MKIHFERLFLLSVTLLMIDSSAVAQGIEEVIVTAQRRAQSLQEVPVAVSAFTADDLAELGWDRPNEIAAQVPNMQVSTPYGDVQPLFAIRGISMIDYTPSQASPIGVYLDEGYLGATYTHGMSMFDLERIEVLRGPQGTLYGKNTTGGAVNLISKTPDVDAPTSGHIEVGTGNFGMTSADAAIESALSEGTFAARVAVTYKQADGYWTNTAGPDMGETDYVSGRVTFNWEPTDRFAAVLKFTGGSSDALSTPPRITATAGPGITVAGRPSNTERHQGAINYVGSTEVDMTITNLKLSFDLNNFSLVSVSNFYDAEYFQAQDTDGTTAELLEIDWSAETQGFSQDLRLVSEFDGPVSFIAGVYFGKEETDTHIVHRAMWADPAVNPTLTLLGLGAAQFDPALSAHLLVLADALPQFGQADRHFDVEKESIALYTNLDWDISDRLGIGVGLRYTDETNTRDYVNYSRLDFDGTPLGSWLPGNLLSPQFIALGIDAPFVTWGLSQQLPLPAGMYLDGPYTTASGDVRERSEDEISGKFSINYQALDSTMVYASYSRGFRSGSFNNGFYYADQLDPNGVYVEPEFVDAYEIGFKGDYLDNRVRFNGAAFFYDYENQQFVNQVGVSALLANAGGAEISGIELELTALVTDNLTVTAGLGLLDSEYTELALPRLSTALDPLDSIDLAGNELVSSPDTNFNYMINYELPIGTNWYTRFVASGNYIGDQWFSAYNDLDGHAGIRQDAYWVHNARLTFASSDDKLAVSLFGQNVFDEEFDVYAINLQGGFGYNYFMEGRPRTYGAELTYRF